MRRLASWAGIAAVVAASLALAVRPGDAGAGPAGDADSIAAGLRCPVCQGLSVKDSNSQTARDIRDDIRRRLEAGESAAEIRRAYVERYGEWILLRPGATGFEALVWAVPAAAVAGGAVALGAGFWRWRRAGRRREPTPEDRALVTAALAGDGTVGAER